MLPTPILGVDFSGAALAGRKIWVSHATEKKGGLQFHDLRRAADLPNGAEERGAALLALCAWISSFENPICGLDFPFSLARDEFGEENWESWLEKFAQKYPDAENFRENAVGTRRETDIAAKTPFSPLNLRLYRQTYFGIRDVLAPLVRNGARVAPMMKAGETAPLLLEICPASLLKRKNLYFSYKGQSELQEQNRVRILEEMARRTPFSLPKNLEILAKSDFEGDALDAILAGVATWQTAQDWQGLAPQNETETREGRVFF